MLFGRGEGSFSGWSKAKAALDLRIAKSRNPIGGGKKPSPLLSWRLHDLRRTVATRMADLGVDPHVIEAVFNHVSGVRSGVAGIYNRALYSNEKRARSACGASMSILLWPFKSAKLSSHGQGVTETAGASPDDTHKNQPQRHLSSSVTDRHR